MNGITMILSNIPDPRINRKKLYSIQTVLGIALCCLLSGGEDFVDMEEYGKTKADMLKELFDMSNGVPSHDTFRRVFGLINPDEFGAILSAYAGELLHDLSGKQICIDGKCVRGTKESGKRGNTCLTILSAFVSEHKIVVAQKSVDKKSNEITAIPAVLAQINLEKAIISIDAMGCQREVAEMIANGGGIYLLAVKENQPTLHKEVADFFAQTTVVLSSDTTTNDGHGRIETRNCSTSEDLSTIHVSSLWKGLKTIIKVQSVRVFKNSKKKEEHQIRYYISNGELTAAQANKLIRNHWKIENNLHWQLDVTFREDNNTVVDRITSHNLNTFRKVALQILEQNKTPKLSKKSKRKRAGWDDKYLLELLKNIKVPL